MSSPRRSPRARLSQSQSALGSRNLNLDQPIAAPAFSKSPARMPKHRASLAAPLATEVMLQLGHKSSLSPRRQARRSLKPRKSILKSLSASSLAECDNEEMTMDFTAHYGHTITSGRPSLARRVSFASHAHVRMFESEKEKAKSAASTEPQPIPPFKITTTITAPAAPRPATSHSRRSSIQNINAIGGAQTFVGDGDGAGEESMDLETDEEASDSDDEGGVHMGQQPFVSAEQDAEGESDGEADMSMDETRAFGGIVARQSLGAMSEVSDVTVSDADGEQTMEFTIAIGGALPNSPPVGASKGRNSIGYSLPQSPNSVDNPLRPGQAVAGEVDMDMDETVAFGGIIDESYVTSSSEGSAHAASHTHERTGTYNYDIQEDGMEMTMAAGGILPPASPHHSLTRPMFGTPSFARPTLSSSQRTRDATPKEKRNVFAPSPSPFKSTTPRKSGMETAGEVAKRLSFGSVTSSGGKKRPAQDENEAPGSAKKPRPTITRNIFAPPTPGEATAPTVAPRAPVSPIRAQPTLSFSPIKISHNVFAKSPAAKATPARLIPQTPAQVFNARISTSATPKKTPAKSPGRSPFLKRMLGQPVDEDEMDEQSFMGKNISLDEFLSRVGVEFEPPTKPTKRRSSMAHGLLGQSDREFGLHEYAEAQIHNILFNMYSWASRKMEDDIEVDREDILKTEQECSLENPRVMSEYLASSAEEQGLYADTLQALKRQMDLLAHERWYDWHLALMKKVEPDVEEMLESMQEDDQRLIELSQSLDDTLPELQARFAMLQGDLERERAVVKEISECDPAELTDLKEAMTEQNTEILRLKGELDESTSRLCALQTKMSELDSTKASCVAAISSARSRCDQYTRSDILRFKEEYQSLQHLHLWRVKSTQSDLLALTYDQEISLSFKCVEGQPQLRTAAVELLSPKANKARYDDDLTQGLFGVFRDTVSTIKGDSLANIVQQIGDLWTAVQRQRYELGVLNLTFPLSYRQQTGPTGTALVISATLLFRELRSKVGLSIVFDRGILLSWPASLADVEIDAKTIYGCADAVRVRELAREGIAVATPSGFLAALLQICSDVCHVSPRVGIIA